MKKKSSYAASEIAWLRNNYPLFSVKELTERFNALFECDRTVVGIKSIIKKHNIKSGRTGHFPPGLLPWNTGTKGIRCSPKTEFQKGSRPHNALPVGSERVTEYDIVQIKVAEPNKWRSKHVLIHEQYHGPTPKGSVVIFLDGNRRNFSIHNLMLVKRTELLQLNRQRFSAQHPELKPALLAMVKIDQRIRELEVE